MAQNELFDMSLANFRHTADSVSKAYSRYSMRVVFMSFAISVTILILYVQCSHFFFFFFFARATVVSLAVVCLRCCLF